MVVSAGLYLETGDVPDELLTAFRAGLGPHSDPRLLLDGGSAIIGPDGAWIVPPVRGEQRVITAEIELDELAGYRLDLDLAGHYARPDVFELGVRRFRRPRPE